MKAVFLSYSHDSDEHRDKVLGLAERLRRDGFDARLDQYVNGTPEQGWPRWMLDGLDEASFVLVVCTETYYRRFRGHEVPGQAKGAAWEGALITQEIYDAWSRTVKFVPVLLAAGQERFIPEPLRRHTHYGLTSEERYLALYRFLIGRAGVEPSPLGEIKPFLMRVVQPLTFGPAPEPPCMGEPKARQENWSTRSRSRLQAAAMLAGVIGTLSLLLAPSIRQLWWRQGTAAGKNSSTQVLSPIPHSKPAPPVVETCRTGEELNENGIVFVRICPGTFTMGSAEGDRGADADEKPTHEVRLSEFWIGKTETTNEQYRRFRSDHQGDARLPVTGVSWDEAKAACEHFEGRLPTEAEWEYAARAGSQTAWSCGTDEKRLGEYSWYGEASSAPHPVGMKKPNAWGLHDMHGNVREWIADRYSPNYPRGPQTDPYGPTAGEFRVLRGGAVNFSPSFLRSAFRDRAQPTSRDWVNGFRCARALRRHP